MPNTTRYGASKSMLSTNDNTTNRKSAPLSTSSLMTRSGCGNMMPSCGMSQPSNRDSDEAAAIPKGTKAGSKCFSGKLLPTLSNRTSKTEVSLSEESKLWHQKTARGTLRRLDDGNEQVITNSKDDQQQLNYGNQSSIIQTGQ